VTTGGPELPTVSIIVPVYNSRATVAELVRGLHPVLEQVSSRHEIVLVNDGSWDDSWDVVRDLATRDERVRGIDLMRNYGQHNALLCGIRAAAYDVVVTMDDDLQHPPDEVPRLLAHLAEGFDVVYGTPVAARHGLWRNMASHLTKLALRHAMGVPTARDVSAFRAFRTHLRDAFAAYRGPFVSIDVLLTWASTRFTVVPVRHDARPGGRSNYSVPALMVHALNMLTGFSTWPLRLASITGFGFTLFGFGVLIYVVGRYLMAGSSVPGFPFLASVIAIFSGAQLFAVGVIGEYLGRMHFRMMERPTYTVRSRTSKD
jgi:undecaprenyl-phosphate 4-deoxy-4-formamido-L-arabinose transferase